MFSPLVVPGSLFGLEPKHEEPSGSNPSETPTTPLFDFPETPKPRKRRRIDIAKVATPCTTSSLNATEFKGTPFPRLSQKPFETTRAYEYRQPPPTTSELLTTLDVYDVPSMVYQAPFYSNEEDAPEHPREYAGLLYHLKGGTGIGILEDWVGHTQSNVADTSFDSSGIYGWEYAATPPSVRQTKVWLEQATSEKSGPTSKTTSQVFGYVSV